MSQTTQNYVRQPAAALLNGNREQAQDGLIQSLIMLIGKHLPGMQPELQKLTQEMGQVQMQIDESQTQLVLQGHGTKGVLLSQKIKTAKDEAAFKALAPTPAEKPANAGAMLQILNQYMTLQLIEQGQQAMVLPTAEIFGPLFHDITDEQNTDLVAAKDGVYLVKSDEYAFYSIRIQLDEKNIMLLSSNSGPTIATFSDYEEQWIQHRNWALVDEKLATDKLTKFFSKANVHAPSKSEIKRLAEQLGRMVKDAGQAKATEELVSWEEQSYGPIFKLKLNDIFTMTMDGLGVAEVDSTRKDLSWDDLTQYTQRQMFEGFQKRLVAASQKANPTKAAKKAAAKKRR